MDFSRQSCTEVKLPGLSNPISWLRGMCVDNTFEMTHGTGADVFEVSADMYVSFEQFSDLPSRHAAQSLYKSASPATRSDLPNTSVYNRRNHPVTGPCSSENNYGLPDDAGMKGISEYVRHQTEFTQGRGNK